MLINAAARLRALTRAYPRQYWLLMAGMLVNTIGMGFVWPFLNIYLKEQLGIPLSIATMLPMLEQMISLFTTLGAGSVADRFGRKGLMTLSLAAVSGVYILMGFAGSWWMFAALMGLRGFFLPLYRVGADTMVGDLISDEERRLPAYSLLRTVNNLGVAIGPVLGGIVAAYSYTASFLTAAGTLGFFAMLVGFGMVETLPRRAAPAAPTGERPVAGGMSYRVVLQDTLFLMAVLAFTFNGMGSGLPFQLIGIYGKENFGVTEDQTGLIIMVNALMVVTLQVAVANFVRRYHRLKVLSVGALFYAAGIGSIALGSSFYHFALSMGVLTIGELLIAPTFTSFTANLAPDELRGRYMSVYWVGWSFSRGLGPAIAGQVYDSASPAYIWIMGAGFNLAAAALFIALAPAFTRRMRRPAPQPNQAAASDVR
ncbi:MAG: MDR family MFS transporter [Chloroflexota bacterium]